MRKYESVFIFAPNLSDEERVARFDRMKNVIEAAGATVEIDEWGTRKLAYEINDFKEGYYYVCQYEANNEVLTEVDRIAHITDGLLRNLTLKMEK